MPLIAPDDPLAPDVRALLERHLAFARATTRPEDVHAMEVEALVDPAVTFFSYRSEEGAVLGVAALKRLDDSHAEIKSMHTAAEARGRGVARALVAHLVEHARARGFSRVSLETGAQDAFAPARALYASAGFAPCGPFGPYDGSPNSAYMTLALEARNLAMARRIEAAPARYPLSFVVAGDSGAWPDPTADAIVSALIAQAARLEPAFFANLGDFAGPGTRDRHEHWLQLAEPLGVPNICAIGNHDLDDPAGPGAWAAVHGPRNFEFGHGHTRFVVLDAAPGRAGEVDIDPNRVEGPDEEALAFMEDAFARAAEPHRVALMHCPPAFGGRFAPHPEWGFSIREAEFLALVERHRVGLVCCAHALLFDTWEHRGTRFVVSGGGGTALCSHHRGVCAAGDGRPEDRGALFHAVQLLIAEDGAVSGRVLQAFEPDPGRARITFGG